MKKSKLILFLLALTALTILLVACTGKVVLVRFYVDDELYATEKTTKGGSLDEIPDVPEKEGYSGSWSVRNFDSVQSDMKVTAIYTPNGYNVSFYADGVLVAKKWVKNGATLTDVPSVPTKEGFTGSWAISDFVGLTSDTTVQAVYKKIPSYVYFLADEYVYNAIDFQVGATLTGEYYELRSGDYVVTSDKTAKQGKVYYKKTQKILFTREIRDGRISDVPEVPTTEGLSSKWMRVSTDKDGKEILTEAVFTDLNGTIDVVCHNYVTVTLKGGAERDVFVGYEVGESVTAVEKGVEEREEYEFFGWYEDEKLLHKIEFPFVATENTTFYAKWMSVKASEGLKFENGAVVSYTGTDKDVYIPYKHDGVLIERVGEDAFNGNTEIESVHLSGAVTAIGARAFASCSALENLVFPDGSFIETIEESAFEGCSSITDFAFPETVKAVGERAFYGCSSLRVASGTENTSIEIVSPYAFASCKSLAVLNLPQTVTEVGEGAFSGDENLTLAFEDASALKKIGAYAFKGNKLFAGVDARNIEEVGEGAYDGCYSASVITAVTGNSVLRLMGKEEDVSAENLSRFYGVEEEGVRYAVPLYLYEVTIVGNGKVQSRALYDVYSVKKVNLIGAEEIESEAFYLENYLPTDAAFTINLPTTLTAIGEKAFSARADLKEIALPATLVSLGDEAFSDIYALKTVTLPQNNALETVGKDVFAATSWFDDAYGLVTLGKFVLGVSESYCRSYNYREIQSREMGYCEAIAPYAFYNNQYLRIVALGDRISEVGDYAFAACENLNRFIFDANTVLLSKRTLGEKILDGCNNLENLTIFEDIDGKTLFTEIPASLKKLTVGYASTDSEATVKNLYEDFENVEELEIGDGYLSIGESAFVNNVSLKKLFVAPSVMTIEKSAFENVPLTSIEFSPDANLVTIGENAFKGSQAINVNFPNSLKEIQAGAFENSYVYEANLPNVTTLGERVFKNAALLTSITLGEELETMGDFALSGTMIASLTLPASLQEVGTGAITGTPALYMLTMNKAFSLKEMLKDENGDDTRPAFLSTVRVLSGDIPDESFKNITSLQTITLNRGVTGIGKSAFEGCYIRSISIPNTVRKIDERAFANCVELRSCQIESVSSALTSLGKEIFKGDEMLTYAVLPDTVTQEDTDFTAVFDGCANLQTANLPKNVAVVGERAFAGCAELTGVNMSENVTEIGKEAFLNAKKLDFDAVLNNLEIIGENAFAGCETMRGIKAKNVKEIGENAFVGATNMKEITVGNAPVTTYTDDPSKIETLNVVLQNETGAATNFDGCDDLKIVLFYGKEASQVSAAVETVPDDVIIFVEANLYERVKTTVTKDVYSNPTSETAFDFSLDRETGTAELLGAHDNTVRAVYLPSEVTFSGTKYKVTSIGQGAFTNGSAPQLQYVIIPSSVKSIGDNAFKDVKTLASVRFENGSEITTIGASAFAGCSALEKIDLPSKVETIGNSAFDSCVSMKSFSFFNDSELKTIGDYAFAGASALEKFEIKSALSKMGKNAFNGCINLEYFSFGEKATIKEIADSAFGGCIKIYELTLPDSVTAIGKNSFRNCNALTYINNAVNLVSIGESAFSASGLNHIELGGASLVSIGKNAFAYCNDLNGFVVPSATRTIGEGAFTECKNLWVIHIGENVTDIGRGAFSGCVKLQEIHLWAKNLEDLEENNNVFSKAGAEVTEGLKLIVYDSVERIPAYFMDPSTAAFAPNLVKVEYDLDPGLKEIASYAFANVTKLSEFIVPPSVLIAGENIFKGSRELTVSVAAVRAPMRFDAAWATGTLAVTYGYNNVVDGEFAYWSTGFSAFVTEYRGTDKILTIPTETNGKIVISLGSAFEGNETIEEITVSGGLNTLGSLYNCTALKRVRVLSELKEIGEGTFFGCVSLNAFVVGETIEKIGKNAFENCASLATVYVDSATIAANLDDDGSLGCLLNNVSSVRVKKGLEVNTEDGYRLLPKEYDGYNVYSKLYYTLKDTDEENTYVYLVEDPDTDEYIIVASGVGRMNDYTARSTVPWKDYVEKITKAYLDENVTSVGKYAFADMTNLKEVYLDSVTATADKNAFYNSGSDFTLYVGEKTTKIPSELFSSNKQLKNISFASGNALKTIGREAFSTCTGLTEITIPDSVTTVEEGAFAGCSSVTTITLGENIVSVGQQAFNGETKLRTLNYNAVRLGDMQATTLAFAANENTAAYGEGFIVNVGNKVTTVPAYAFYRCVNVQGVNFADRGALNTIGEYAFAGCENLVAVTLPTSLVTLSSRSFYEATKLATLSFGTGTPSLRDICPDVFTGTAFFNNNNNWTVAEGKESVEGVLILNNTYLLKAKSGLSGDYIIGGTIKVVAHEAFYGCNALEYVRVPAALEYIGNNAFGGCDRLKTTYLSSRRVAAAVNAEDAMGGLLKQATHVYVADTVLEKGGKVGDYINTKYKSIKELIHFSAGSYYLFTTAAWTLSENLASNVSGYLVNDEQNVGYYVLRIDGQGNMQDYTIATGMPWKSYASLIDKAVVSSGVKSIGAYAFFGCDALTEITLSQTLEKIGEGAFKECENLLSLTIPEAVTIIGKYAFENCAALQNVRFNATKANDLEENNGAFAGVGTNYESGITLTVGRNVTYLPSYAFSPSNSGENTPKFKTVTFASTNEINECEIIGKYAFAGLDTLQNVGLPSGAKLKTIEEGAFENCSSLVSFVLTANVTEIGKSAFKNCVKVEQIVLNATAFKEGKEDNNAFENTGKSNENGWKLAVSDKAKYLPSHVFENSAYLQSVEFAKGEDGTEEGANSELEEIGEKAFENCVGLTKIFIPKNTKKVGRAAFAGCTGARSYTAPFIGGEESQTEESGVTLFGYVFGEEERSGTTASRQHFGTSESHIYYIPNNLTSVRITKYTNAYYGAFMNCTKIRSVSFDSDVEPTVYKYGFDADGKTLIVLARTENGSLMGPSAFENCSSLTTVNLPTQMKTIGMRSFMNCEKLSAVTISDNVEKIGASAFENCYALATVYFNAIECADTSARPSATVGDVSTNVFAAAGMNDQGINVVFGNKVTRVPAFLFSVTSDKQAAKVLSVSFTGTACEVIGKNAFYGAGASSLTSVSLPQNLREIGEKAFEDTAYYRNVNNWSSDVLYIGNYIVKARQQINPDNGAYSVRNNTTLIADCAFEGCNNIATVSLPDSVEFIGNKAFASCRELTTVQIGVNSKLQRIGSYAFSSCAKLGTAEVDGDKVGFSVRSNVTEIGDYAFNGCDGLTSVYLDSPTVAGGLNQNSYTTFGGIIMKANFIYINSAVNATGNYVLINYDKSNGVYSGGYYRYEKNN